MTWEGEPAVALPLRRPPWWYLLLFGGMALALAAIVVVAAVRVVAGRAPDGAVTTTVALVGGAVLVGLCCLAVRGTLLRRRDPGSVVVTPTRLVCERVVADWAAIDAVRAHQEQRLGHLRAIDIAVVDVRGVTCTIFEAAGLDVDPRRAVEVLRHLHAHPDDRERLISTGADLFAPDDRSTR